MYILSIETATNVCSVAVSEAEKIIFEKVNTEGPSHASLLGVFVQEAIDFLKKKNIQLDAVAVSSGPGSYTGLRIGVSEAKGLCFGLGIPLIAIETLKIMARKVQKAGLTGEDDLLCPMIDARRMEVYSTIFDSKMNVAKATSADIIDENSYGEFFAKRKIFFFGNGAEKCMTHFEKKNAEFIPNIYPTASDMVELAAQAYSEKTFVDVAYYEPFYLKEFVATTPKNKIFNC